MITVKKLLRLGGMLLLVTLLFSSCMSGVLGDLPFLPADGADSEVIGLYRIVMPWDASAELSQAISSLRTSIAEKTGVKTEIYRSGDRLENYTDAWDIYVGYCSAERVYLAMRDMRSEDYTCRSYDGRYTVIGGRSEAMTLKAIERFASEILPASDNRRLIPEGGGFDVKGEYPVESVTLLGTDISQYVILCDRDVSGEVSTAYSLRQAITDRAGYYMDIKHEYGDNKNIMLSIDEDCLEGEAYILATEDGVLLRAHSPWGLRIAARDFLDILCPEGSAGRLVPSVSESLLISYTEPVFSIASFCGKDATAPIDITHICLEVDVNEPQAILFGELGAEDKERVQSSLTDYNDRSSETGMTVMTLGQIGAEVIYTERISELRVEGYRLRSGDFEFILLYVSGSVDSDTYIEIPEALKAEGLPIAAIVHGVNSSYVTVTWEENEDFGLKHDQSVTEYGDVYAYRYYIDKGHLTASLGPAGEMKGYRQINIRQIS